MAKKTTKTEEAAVGSSSEQAAPLTWTVSDDMMSITLSDGRVGCAVEHGDGDWPRCEHCIMDGICDSVIMCGTAERMNTLLPESIVWVDANELKKHPEAQQRYWQIMSRPDSALPPVALHEVEAIERKDEAGKGRVELIPLNLIDQSPYQVRVVDVESESFKELVVSIVESGLINPITVRFIEATGRYELIAGHRRFAACEMIGMLVAPCYMLKVSDRKAEDMTCCENLNREDLLPIDEALTVKAMLDHGRTREEIAKITGKSTRWVYRREAAARLEPYWIEKAKRLALSSKFLEFAAALDATTREKIYSTQFDGALFENGGNLGMLEKLSMVAHRKLVAAPWMGVCPEECNACKKRTDASELVAEDGESFCLDAECWARHMDELADRTAAKCQEKGIPVKRVTEGMLFEMDVEEARSEEYDTCVISTSGAGAVVLYWGRSQPKCEKLQKKAAVKKPTEQNVFEMAYSAEILRRIERLDTSVADLNSFLACALMVGIDLSGFQGIKTKAFVCDQRTKDMQAWISGIYDSQDGDPGHVFVFAFQDCVIAGLRNRLECRNPFDTMSQYTQAVAVAAAFSMDANEVKDAVQATIKQAKKRK
jgi:ParB/RepB/Spo0J family partition protein